MSGTTPKFLDKGELTADHYSNPNPSVAFLSC